mgnify:CR=1 FL=1|jgi:hypothetical protein
MSKKRFITIFVLWTLIVSAISAQQSYTDISGSAKIPVFKESFDNNSNEWLLDNSWIQGKVANGHYNLVCRNYQKSTGLSYKTISIDQGRDYEIETSVNTLKGTGGLVFGMNSKYDHYRIELTSYNTLVLLKNTPSRGRNEELFSTSLNSNTKAGSYYKITLRKLNDNFYIFLNEGLIGVFNRIKPEGDQVGFNVGLNSEISVDYLNISYLTSQNNPIVAEKNPVVKDSIKTLSEMVAAGIPAVKKSSGTPIQTGSDNSKNSVAPEITWISPLAITTRLDTYTARVRVNIKSVSELKSALFYVNGSSRGDGEIRSLPGLSGMYLAEKTITLEPGENNVYLVAANLVGASKSDIRYFNNPLTNPPEIKWGIPTSSSAIVSTETFTMEVCIKSPADLISAKVLVDGVQVTVGKAFQRSEGSNCNYIWKPQIILKEGDNSIYVIVENIAGSTTSENRIIKFNKAIAERRLALVIGNSDYMNGASLKNPVNDANLMEATLKSLGFVVIKQLNSGRDGIISSIREFSKKLSDYNVALFYYAGHGLQVDGVNYLIPTNAKLENKDDCKWEAIAVNTVTDEFKKNSANTNIVILDACRNNPYRSWARGGEPGFKALAPIIGTIISFSTSEGATAADGDGANGIFTEELVKQMAIPQQIESVFKKTRKQVIERTNGQQTPTEWSYLTGDFYFKKQ